MTPKQATRNFCIQCVSSADQVLNCGGHKMYGQGDENNQCWFYPYRLGKGRLSVKVIRRHCLECMGGSYKLVASCPTHACPVRDFRFGTNPNRTRKPEKILVEEMA